MNVDSCVDVACSVEQYEHKTMDVAVEQGKLRASVEYKATLLPTGGELESIHEIWNFEKQNGMWYVIGVEEA